MKLENVPREVWEKICVLELKRGNYSTQFIKNSIECGFIMREHAPTKITHMIYFKNSYFNQANIISLNILDMSNAPYWIVKYLENLGYECPILFSTEND